MLTPAHETQPRQNPVLLVSSRAGKGSQIFSSHLGRYNHLETILPRNEQGSDRDISRYVVPSNAAEWRPRNEKNAAFEYPLADRPLQRSRYGRCTRKPMGKKSTAAIHRRTLRPKSSAADKQKESQKFRPILDVTITLGRFCRETNPKTAAIKTFPLESSSLDVGDYEGRIELAQGFKPHSGFRDQRLTD